MTKFPVTSVPFFNPNYNMGEAVSNKELSLNSLCENTCHLPIKHLSVFPIIGSLLRHKLGNVLQMYNLMLYCGCIDSMQFSLKKSWRKRCLSLHNHIVFASRQNHSTKVDKTLEDTLLKAKLNKLCLVQNVLGPNSLFV